MSSTAAQMIGRLHQVSRVTRWVRHAALISVRNPTVMLYHLRDLVGALLADQFDRESPILSLPDHVTARIYTSPVLAPPPVLFETGNQGFEGLAFLVSLGRAIGASTIFEIGTYNGLTSWCLSSNLPEAVVHTLDLPAEKEPKLPLDLGAGDLRHRVRFKRAIYETLPGADHVVQHWDDSATFDFSPWQHKCDLVYVDGAHSKAYVGSDTDNAIAMLSDVGAIVWDDYWWRIDGVREVLEHRTDLQLFRVPGTRLVVHMTRRAWALIGEENS